MVRTIGSWLWKFDSISRNFRNFWNLSKLSVGSRPTKWKWWSINLFKAETFVAETFRKYLLQLKFCRLRLVQKVRGETLFVASWKSSPTNKVCVGCSWKLRRIKMQKVISKVYFLTEKLAEVLREESCRGGIFSVGYFKTRGSFHSRQTSNFSNFSIFEWSREIFWTETNFET